MLWAGRRLEEPFNTLKISPFQPEKGLPNHILLSNLSVFLKLDDMRSYNELAESIDKWAELSEDDRCTILGGLNEVVSKAGYGFWTVSDPEQIKTENGLKLEDLNYPTDGKRFNLTAYMLSDDEVAKVLGSVVKGVSTVKTTRDTLVAELTQNQYSLYADQSFTTCMNKFSSMVCRDFIVKRDGEEPWSGRFVIIYKSMFFIIVCRESVHAGPYCRVQKAAGDSGPTCGQ